MRISDWSSDVCSSDRLAANIARRVDHARDQLGRCREIAGNFREAERVQTLPQFLRLHARRIDGGREQAPSRRALRVLRHLPPVIGTAEKARRVIIAAAMLLLFEIGRAHVCTTVTNAQLVCRILTENKQQTTTQQY